MKVVILAGGFGTRIIEESQFRPKPMIELGGMPIIWHIMKLYSYYGYNDFIICAGYKQQIIKKFFADYFLYTSDITYDYTSGYSKLTIHRTVSEPWRVTVVDTGLNTMTGGRIKRIQPYVGDDVFMMTYGDAVCDINIDKLVRFHREHGRLATLSSVMQKQQKGILDVTDQGSVRSFREKNANDGTLINAGFMVLQPETFGYLKDDQTIFETEPLEHLARENQLMSYHHTGFWQCIDTERERQLLERLWATGNAPWKIWQD